MKTIYHEPGLALIKLGRYGLNIDKYDDYELPGRICNALGITEPEYEEA